MPAPRQTVRVGLVACQHLEPPLTADINALIDRLAVATEVERPVLLTAIKAYGGAAFPVLAERQLRQDAAAALCRQVLRELDLVEPIKD